ncbi:hypothetical protein ACHHYP_12644 [Achlya hypogyna]|uniref:Uncharacterized protein n=1 Tax=Achlya hypogyna TaxID=1202772 RepID=A0A1V9YGN1_ACHHY|nr:hypothetical protein ACHHYP_12644 [Achlya hypogyna]
MSSLVNQQPDAGLIHHHVAMDLSRADIPALQQKIAQAKQELADGYAKIDSLQTQNGAARAKIEQLEKDADSVTQLTTEAEIGRRKLQRRLSDVGGHENTLMVLMAALADTKAEIARLRNEKTILASNRKDIEKEIAGLHVAVAKSMATSEELKQEIASVNGKRHETELKLRQIATFLSTNT